MQLRVATSLALSKFCTQFLTMSFHALNIFKEYQRGDEKTS
jgi:hypothetical protein